MNDDSLQESRYIAQAALKNPAELVLIFVSCWFLAFCSLQFWRGDASLPHPKTRIERITQPAVRKSEVHGPAERRERPSKIQDI